MRVRNYIRRTLSFWVGFVLKPYNSYVFERLVASCKLDREKMPTLPLRYSISIVGEQAKAFVNNFLKAKDALETMTAAFKCYNNK